MVGDSFASLGPPLLPWENRMGREQTTDNERTSRLPFQIGPVGRLSENTLELDIRQTSTQTDGQTLRLLDR